LILNFLVLHFVLAVMAVYTVVRFRKRSHDSFV